MSKPDKPPGKPWWSSGGDSSTKTTVTATIRQLADTCAIRLQSGKNITIAASQARDSCALVVNAVGMAPQTDFDYRKTGPGVVRYFDFDTNAQLGASAAGANFGIFSNSNDALNLPVIDTTVKASGTGSLRFDIRSQSFPDAQWYGNFSADLGTRFGANTTHYVQWRLRMNQAMIDTLFLATDGTQQGGIKQFIAGPGDTATKKWGSCEAIHCVVQTFYQQRFPIAYNSCTGSGTHPAYSGFYESLPNGDIALENAMGTPFCTRQGSIATVAPAAPTGCFAYVANEFMTFEYEIVLGARNNVTEDFSNSSFKLWAARENGQAQLLINWNSGVGGYFPLAAGPLAEDQQFGKIWLLPYMTDKSKTQVTPLGQVWYDELIISRNWIPFPASQPTWRQSITVPNIFTAIPGTSSLQGYEWPQPWVVPPGQERRSNKIISGYSGLTKVGMKFYSMAAAGHDGWQNTVGYWNMSTTPPQWVVDNTCSDYVAAGVAITGTGSGPYYPGDGRPVGTQNYWDDFYISAGKLPDGLARVMRFMDLYPFMSVSNAAGGAYSGGTSVKGYRLASQIWDSQYELAHGQPLGSTWANLPAGLGSPTLQSPPVSMVQDPATEIVYMLLGGSIYYWVPATGVATLALNYSPARGTSKYSGGLAEWETYPSLMDSSRNRLVCPLNPEVSPLSVTSLQFVTLPTTVTGTYIISNLALSGTVPSRPISAGFVWDQDNDRYILVTGEPAGYVVYAIHPVSGATTLLQTIPYLSAGDATAIFSRIAYWPELGGIVMCPEFSSNILFLPTR